MYPNFRSTIALQVFSGLLLIAIGCGKYSQYTAKIVGARLANANNSGKVPYAMGNGATIKANTYAIALYLQSVIYKKDGNKDVQGETTFGLSNNATGVIIVTLTDFNARHSTGADMADCFAFVNDTLAYQLHPMDSSVFSAKWTFHNSPSPTDTFYSNNYFILMQPPDAPGNYRFAVNVNFADSTQFNDTLNVYLK